MYCFINIGLELNSFYSVFLLYWLKIKVVVFLILGYFDWLMLLRFFKIIE